MANLQDHRVVCWAERAVLLIAVAYLGLHTLPRSWAKLITDFPNYYLTARLVHEGYDTARMYEWTWLQREKDHRSIDGEAVGLIPNTPLTSLVVWPLSSLRPLTAKRLWILMNLALLAPLCRFLHSLTGLSYQRLALVVALSFPLHRNLLFGQYYVFLLLLIVAACWCYVRKFYATSGALIAIAAVCKIFPVLFLLLFLQRRAWRALASFAATSAAAIALSITVFGWNVHRTFLREILPWALRGDAMPPYGATSISGILHYLFLSEPQWNPHPWHESALIYALLQPAFQTLLLAPAILLIRWNDQMPRQILLEWAGLLTASLAISTLPASYHFVLMIFPVCVLGAMLIERRRYGWLIALLIAYLGIGFPMPNPGRPVGPAILFYAPRIFLMMAVLLGNYFLLWRNRQDWNPVWDWTHYAWASFLTLATLVGMHAAYLQQRAVRQEYAYRVPLEAPALLDADPIATGWTTHYVALMQGSYHLVAAGNTTWVDSSLGDDLSASVGRSQSLVEKARSQVSDIVDLRDPLKTHLQDGRNPMLSNDGQSLAFVRDDHGRGRLMVRQAFQSGGSSDVALTPPSINVYEATFISQSNYAFSGVANGGPAEIYLTDMSHSNAPLELGESRYPALSPDGRWMAYSRQERGSWNLWIRDQQTGLNRRVADVPCNQIEPSWEDDSKTLVYSTDCGRSLWFTAVSRRNVVP